GTCLDLRSFIKRMRKFNILGLCLLFAAMFAVSANAQVPAAGKIGLVDTGAFFEDKPGAGIPKLKNAVQSVNAEFKKVNDDLTALSTQYQQKVDEYNKLKNSTVPVDNLQQKADAITDLETKIKRDQEHAKKRYDQRMGQVVDPINAD